MSPDVTDGTPGLPSHALNVRLAFDTMVELAVFHEIVYGPGGEAKDYRILDCNPAFTRSVAIAREQVVGRLASELYATNPPYLDTYAKTAATGEPARFDAYFAPMDRWFSISVVSPRRGSFLTIATDVTERHRAEEALSRYQLLAEHGHDIVLFVRREDGRILDTNAAAPRAFGYSREELLSLKIDDLCEQAGCGTTTSRLASADELGVRFEGVCRCKDGSALPVEVSSQGATLEGGPILCVVIRDITERKRAEEALQASEAQLQTIVDNIVDGVIVADSNGRLLRWNRAAREMHGLSPEEEHPSTYERLRELFILSSPDGGRLLPEERPLERIVRGAHLRDVEADIQRTDRPWSRTFSYGGRMVPAVSGKPSMAVVTVRDVTDRKKAERRLAAESARLAVTLHSIAEGVIATDEAGCVTLFNPAAERATGWKAEEVIGRPFRQVFNIVDERTRQPAENPVDRVLRKGEVVGLADQTVLMARDGTERPIADSGAPIRDSKGHVEGVVLVFRDETAERRASVAQAQLAAIVEDSDDAIISKDFNGAILTWNAGAERLLGYSSREVIGRSGDVIVPPERREEDKETLARIRSGERIVHLETQRVTKSGDLLDVSITYSPVRRHGGEIVGVSKIMRDVTVEMRAREALREANRLKDDFLSMASHELKTPLTTLRLLLDTLTRSFRETNSMDRRIERKFSSMNYQLDRMEALVHTLLDVSRITAGRLVLDLAEVDLADVAKEVLERFESEAERSGSEVHLRLHSAIGHWDRMRIDQVITNLVSNALKYGNGQPVEVAVADHGETATVTVRDRGIGISRENHERIFERFERARDSNMVSGLGLGLWIAKRMVEAHRGAIAVESSPGAGATFTVTLPKFAS